MSDPTVGWFAYCILYIVDNIHFRKLILIVLFGKVSN